MFTVGPTFFSRTLGDHPEGDGLTTLQTAFAGGVSTDLSPSARGAGTNTDAVQVRVGTGQLEIDLGGGFNRSLSWSGASLARLPNTGYTAEFFVRFIETVSNPGSSASQLAQVTAWNLAVSRLGMNGYSGGINAYVAESTPAYGYTSTDDIFVKFGPYVHVAHVCNATTNGDLRVYIDGQRVVNYAPGSLQIGSPYNGAIVLGGVCTSSLRAQFSGVRVRHAEMYTGASFTPPTSPADWGPP